MFTKFINCRHVILNEFKNKKSIDEERTISEKLRLEKGLLHEVNYFKELSKKYKKIKNIKNLKNL